MTYFYENLGPDRFQHLSQALLVKMFPDVQCLPVLQPDGGRDAFLGERDEEKPLIVFQVKYVKSPADAEPADKIAAWIKGEKPKIEKLKSWG